jgi:hypothetical protein
MRRFIGWTLLTAAVWTAGCSKSSGPDATKIREYGNALASNQLYKQAVETYQRYREAAKLDEKEEANLAYIMGNLYAERLHDDENALAEYLRIRTFYPSSPLAAEVDKNIVACLERLGRSADAKQALDEAASLDPEKQASRPGTVIASIGDRTISSGDLSHEIDKLPEQMRSQFADPKAKIDFLKQYIVGELAYNAAKRAGMEKDPDVLDAAFQAKRSVMAQKFLQGEMTKNQPQIGEDDVRTYYEANKSRYVDSKTKKQQTWEEARQQAAQDFSREKQQKAFDALMARMMTAERVQIYDDRIK